MIPGPKILLVGLPGAGKTFSLRTLVACGVKPCVLFTENSQATLSDLPEVAWSTIKPASKTFAELAKYMTGISKIPASGLIKTSDPERGKHSQYIEMLTKLANFVDERTGQTFGPVDDWGPERVLIIDSLTNVTYMFLDFIGGSRMVYTEQEWGVAVNIQKTFVKTLVGLNCSVVLISHIQSERDEVTGAVRIFPQGVTKRSSHVFPGEFDEIIYTSASAGRFTWSTAETNIITKSRLLPIAAGQVPSFVPIFEAWKRQGGELPAPQQGDQSTDQSPSQV